MSKDYQDLICPDCGGVLLEVRHNGARNWLCRTAIGEEAFHEQLRCPYIPQPSRHRVVVFWKATDAPIRAQLWDLGWSVEEYDRAAEGKRKSA